MNENLKIYSLVADFKCKNQNCELKKDLIEIIKSYMRPTRDKTDSSECLFFKNILSLGCLSEEKSHSFLRIRHNYLEKRIVLNMIA